MPSAAAGMIHIEFRKAWWLEHYLVALLLFCAFFGTRPDEGKLARMLLKGFRWRFRGESRWRRFRTEDQERALRRAGY